MEGDVSRATGALDAEGVADVVDEFAGLRRSRS
jgi:hypothetical protein